jgi:asparagine synthase (glutamine-hydrolysing)
MCGIAGILSLDERPVTRDDVLAMTGAIPHRGPDDEGTYLATGIGMGMRRLSIIDLQTGRQPISNEDGTVWVVLNGEIYDFRALRQELEAAGHRFSTTSDTEVIVHLYEEHGPACVERLRGMFAFALWDAFEQRLLLARDRIGIKPLYHARFGNRLYFASELKSILAHPEVPAELDWGSVHHYFSFMTTPADRSILRGVEKLEPGRLLVATPRGSVEEKRYWEPRFEPDPGPSEAEWCERLRETLRESVRLHMVSDVPLGAFLSGGVDSSSVVAAMADASADSIRTFSVGFRESDYDELEHARRVAETFGTRHREAVLEPDALDVLDDVAWHLDEPFGDSSAIPTFLVSRLAAEDVKVVLSGDGGDELFAGYDKYVVEGRERWNRFLPAPVRALLGAVGRSLPEGATGKRFLRHLSLVGGDRFLDAGTLFQEDQKRKLFQPEAFRRIADRDPRPAAYRYLDDPDVHWLSALQRFDLETYLPLDILTKVDRMSMAHSIETRVPLLDHRLIELATRIPPELQLRHGRTKHLFKRALEGWLPRQVLDRPKQGFAIPLGRWFRGRLDGFVRELLLGTGSRRRELFRPAYLEELLRLHRSGRPLDLELWSLVSFELWCRRFLDQRVTATAALPAAASYRLPTAGYRPEAITAWGPREVLPSPAAGSRQPAAAGPGREPIRVLEFVTSFCVGGTERQFVNLVRGLSRSELEVHVACFRAEGPLRRELPDGELHLREYPIPSLRSPVTLVRLASLVRYLRRHRIDVVHATGLYPNLFGVAAARLARTPVAIASVRDMGQMWRRDLQRTQKLACRFADAVVTNAQAIADRLGAEGYDPGRIEIIPNGVAAPPPARRAGGSLRRELGISDDAPVVGVVCRLDPLKGLDDFVVAAAAIARDHPATRFLVVGGPVPGGEGYGEELRRRGRDLGLGDRLILTGARTDVPDLLPELTVSVLPSLTEGLSNSLLESMAAGLPVVATDVGGNPEIVEDGVTGILVPVEDPATLATAIRGLLESPQRAASLGGRARRSIEERFGYGRMLDRTTDLYLRLLAEARRGRRRRRRRGHLAIESPRWAPLDG